VPSTLTSSVILTLTLLLLILACSAPTSPLDKDLCDLVFWTHLDTIAADSVVVVLDSITQVRVDDGICDFPRIR
jgi:hypothetical protein